MMRSLGWIRLVFLAGAGMSAVPVVAQRAPEHNRGAAATQRVNAQPAPQRQAAAVNRAAPAAAAPRAMTQVGAQTGSQLSLPGRRTSIETQAVTTPARATTPGMMVDRVPQSSGRQPKDTTGSGSNVATPQTPTSTSGYPPYLTGRFNGSNSNPTTDPNKGSSSPNRNASAPNGPEQQQPPVSVYTTSVPSSKQPRPSDKQPPPQSTPEPPSRVPPQTPPPIVVTHRPPRWPHVPRAAPMYPTDPGDGLQFQPPAPPMKTYQPLPSPAPPPVANHPPSPPAPSPAQPSDAAAQPTNSGGSSPSPEVVQNSHGAGSTVQRQYVGEQGQHVVPPPPPQPSQIVPALMLAATTDRPVVGKDVEVVAALSPAEPGAKYQLDWGDGSKEIVSGKASHHYAKAKRYTVSASTKVSRAELNHQIVLDVGPVVWHRVVSVMAVLAGAAAFFFRPAVRLPKLSVSSRWGEPDVPEMKLLTREPYASLSFEPGLGPEEESITFASKGR